MTNEDVDERVARRAIIRCGDIESASSVIKWKCLTCGNEWNASARKVATSGTGCPVCSRVMGDTKRRKTADQFIKDSGIIHSGKYSYDKVEYKNSHTKVIITCHIHGDFQQSPTSHLSGNGCRKCIGDRYRHNINIFIEKARKIHGEEYDYSKFEYLGSKIKGIITCLVHGDFLQKPNTHLAKPAGCPKCDKENRRGSYSIEYFENHPAERVKPGHLYVVRLHQDNQSFIKIGIAADLRKRLNYYYGMKRELLFTKDLSLGEAYELEQRILTSLKSHKFYPQVEFDGYTECIKDKLEVLKLVEDLLVSFD